MISFFEKWDIFYPEVWNRYKRNGVHILFSNFKGINDSDMLYLNTLFTEIKQIYPNDGNHFNIHNNDLRKELHLWKSQNISQPIKNIIEFLNYDINDKIYEPFKLFNDSRYIDQLFYTTKMISVLSHLDRNKLLNEPITNYVINESKGINLNLNLNDLD